MKKIFVLILLSVSGILLAQTAQAQLSGYQADALRYGKTTTGGSARISAMGGVQTALGGDVSAAYLNPAGLGFYNRSEISLTPTFFSSANEASYFGQSSYNYKNDFSLSSLGLVFRGSGSDNTSGWMGGTFAISYQQLNNFDDQFNYSGNNPNNTFADKFLQFSDNQIDNMYNQGDIETQMAFRSGILSDFEDEEGFSFIDTFFPPASEQYPSLQRESVETTGNQGQWNFSYGGNFEDRIYLGGGIGLSSFDYRRNNRYRETADPSRYQENPGDIDFYPNNEIKVEEQLNQTGSGINATLGIIGKPIQNLRLGLSYRTPTFYTIEETFSNNYETHFVDDGSRLFADTVSEFNFQLRSPGAVNAGAAYFFEKYGLISADIEYIDYTNLRLIDDFNALNGETQALSENLTSVVNYRLGGEYRYDVFRFRLGYAYEASPYSNTNIGNFDRQRFSAGFGVRLKYFFADLALVQQYSDQIYNPYTVTRLRDGYDETGQNIFVPTSSPEVTINKRQTTALLTVGVNF